jgi:hypothetical protein
VQLLAHGRSTRQQAVQLEQVQQPTVWGPQQQQALAQQQLVLEQRQLELL